MQYPDIKSYEEIMYMVNDKKIKAVTLGVWEFLVLYPFWEYQDIFRMLEKDFAALYTSKEKVSFTALRSGVKEIAKKQNRFAVTSLDKIYNYISSTESSHISHEETETIKKQECRLAEMYCRRREFGLKVFEGIKETGKKIIIVSDTELPKKTVHRILGFCGYSGWTKLFVSSHSRRTKEYGSLFRKIMKEYNLSADEILNVGSSMTGDYIVPLEIGMKAVWVPSPKRQMTNTSVYSFVTQMLSIDGIAWMSNRAFKLRTVLAQTADALFDTPTKAAGDGISEILAMGVLLAGSDKNDILTKSVMKNSTARLNMHQTENLLEHIGTDNAKLTLPLEYMHKYASLVERELIHGYMTEEDFKKWEDGIESNRIQPKTLEYDFVPNKFFPLGSKKRAFLRFMLKF